MNAGLVLRIALFVLFLPCLLAYAAEEDPGNTFVASPVKKQNADTEPNFISVNGKVIPNPKKQNANPPASAPGGEEPNFISVNGQVVPNPNKKNTA